MRWSVWALAALVVGAVPVALATAEISAADTARIDATVAQVMSRDHVPAVSVAIVRDGSLAFARAYGLARLPGLAPSRTGGAATAATRFAIGSVSKEFTAAAILVLVDRGELSLDDLVAKFLPQLTDANRVTVRQLLSHTAGYRDYFLQEYIPPAMQRPTTVDAILQTWAQRPLDFSPGEQWQYSGTNYVILGRIVELLSGEPFDDFLQEHVLHPVGISDATFADHPSQPRLNAVGYYRFALGPARVAPRTGRNWLFAMSGLEMTAADVARWDLSVIHQSLLSPAAYAAMATDVPTLGGTPTGYGLGFFVGSVAGNDGKTHALLRHPGEISGFRSANFIIPDLGAAIVILTNAEYSESTTELALQLQNLVGVAPLPTRSADAPPDPPAEDAPPETAVEARAHRILEGLAHGHIDRSELAPDAAESFSRRALADIRSSLAALGPVSRVRLASKVQRGGTTHLALTVVYPHRRLQVAEYDRPDGKIEEFMIDDKP